MENTDDEPLENIELVRSSSDLDKTSNEGNQNGISNDSIAKDDDEMLLYSLLDISVDGSNKSSTVDESVITPCTKQQQIKDIIKELIYVCELHQRKSK